MSGARERANGRASGPLLQSLFLTVIDHSAATRDDEPTRNGHRAHSKSTWRHLALCSRANSASRDSSIYQQTCSFSACVCACSIVLQDMQCEPTSRAREASLPLASNMPGKSGCVLESCKGQRASPTTSSVSVMQGQHRLVLEDIELARPRVQLELV